MAPPKHCLRMPKVAGSQGPAIVDQVPKFL
jgi:hypothetical protein